MAEREAGQPSPWSDWLEFGLGTMRLSPSDFWAMSFVEWRALRAGYSGNTAAGQPVPLTRSEFESLELSLDVTSSGSS